MAMFCNKDDPWEPIWPPKYPIPPRTDGSDYLM